MAAMDVTFCVVGDIGEPGPARQAVGKAIGSMLASLRPAFVLATGDNFYECRNEEQFSNAFEQLRAEVLDLVPVPWYFALGNHDVKSVGASLHCERWHCTKGTDHATKPNSLPTWEFRCPASFYSIADDWGSRSGTNSSWDASLLDVIVLNTNKQKGALNLLGLWPGRLNAATSTWKEQKRWLEDKLSTSSATWKLVVGHHPIELIPQSFLEHGIPGVRFLTAGFMKGHQLSRVRRTGLRDIVVRGDADVYLCGHQHLMAHLVRAGEERPSWRGGGPGDGTLDYWIVGSSSKLDQDGDDFETETTDANLPAPTFPRLFESCGMLDTRDDIDSEGPPDHRVDVSESGLQVLSCARDVGSSSRSSSRDSPRLAAEVVAPDLPLHDSMPNQSEVSADQSASSTANSSWWLAESIRRTRAKMSKMWYSERIGFAVISASHTELRIRFYGVDGDLECPRISLLHESVKSK